MTRRIKIRSEEEVNMGLVEVVLEAVAVLGLAVVATVEVKAMEAVEEMEDTVEVEAVVDMEVEDREVKAED